MHKLLEEIIDISININVIVFLSLLKSEPVVVKQSDFRFFFSLCKYVTSRSNLLDCFILQSSGHISAPILFYWAIKHSGVVKAAPATSCKQITLKILGFTLTHYSIYPLLPLTLCCQ